LLCWKNHDCKLHFLMVWRVIGKFIVLFLSEYLKETN
jgi:hypothetical protein